MFFALLAGFVSSDSATCAVKTNCLSCLEVKDCYFCPSTSKCLFVNDTEIKCDNPEMERTKRCVEELGGDAKDSVRYAIGFTILAVAIIVDLTVRFCSRRIVQDEYSHL